MSITVYVPSALRNESGGQSVITMEVTESDSLKDVLDRVAVRHPRLGRRICDEQGRLRRFVNVFIDQDECRSLSGMDTLVEDGAEVRILPSVAGG
ncbi:MAG TPA: MoaD/ThiS family protein [Candidatus Stackebrandtia excrementipullorum]|nr:MoaD/ThiS family protein [Candidatus Stackebrandtia excrementipullorum]